MFESCQEKRSEQRFWIEQGAKALGICHPMQAADYSYRKRTPSKPILEALLKEGVLVPVKAEQADGKSTELVVHRDNLRWVEQAADGALKAERTTFLSPIDSLFWARGRDTQLWNFRHVLEAYIPEPKRQWGYFCLSILHKGRLVGKFDPKVERQSGVLRLKALYLEPGVVLDEELVQDVAGAMSDFMRFHKATDLVIERSQPGEWARTLGALKEHGAVYLNAIGGAAQYYARCITKVEGVHFLELGIPEAVWHIRVRDFPRIVTMDAHGNSLHADVDKLSAVRLAALAAPVNL